MSPPKVLHVMATKEAREALPATVRRFKQDGLKSEPLVFGPHRHPEAVVIPYALYEYLSELADDALIVRDIHSRMQTAAEDIAWDEGLASIGVDSSEFE